MTKLWASFVALIALLGAPATAQSISPTPDKVAVTIYRAPDRPAAEAIDRDWLQGYALITEQRRVRVPAGRSVLRFEGVAAGILPESAIVSGLPQGVREKNLDADLLSPRSLFARSFGRPVTIRREIAKKVVEVAGIIRSGPDGAAILQTRDGFEAVNCGPQTDSLIFPEVPVGLAAKPTLSVELDAPSAADVTVTLSYLAWGFDWQANYVATLRPGGQSADLIAWVTLASSDTTSFAQAETMVVAGKVKREDRAPYRGYEKEAFEFHCFGRPVYRSEGYAAAPLPVMAPMAMMESEAVGYDIVVTASRRVVQEDFGDLKLYRVPDRTTVAALAQKQVALLERPAVPVQLVYVAKVDADGDATTPRITLRWLNRKETGLGVPLPAGPVAVFQPRGGTSLLIGEGSIDDKAIGEEVEAQIADATQVTIESDNPDSGKGWEGYVLTATNANPYPVSFEAQFALEDQSRMSRLTGKLTRKDGKLLWRLEIPANASRPFGYRLADRD
ncbi:DUF4139 domain-containing protein [Sphingomonas psychrolutea]|uniref:DUF4139 domain-containing protein n=1 Tax=Sphingomonas psychrolutea TaxID=1259676 RepID=A0ABQ1GML9_9SPHN|nr:hypothetical protein [Sphingomonas psychrolutea]GGA46658.1 hypothetical protein GCM10011395_16170 [Sphingomonas psychrolutea]